MTKEGLPVFLFAGGDFFITLLNSEFCDVPFLSPAERGLHRREDQLRSGEHLHRRLDEEKNLRRFQGDPGVWSQTPPTGQEKQ